MIDHHVNRPGVYVQQCTQLTGPNRPNDSPQHHHAQQSSTDTRAQTYAHRRTWITSNLHNATQPHLTHTRTCHAPMQLTARAWLRQPGGHGGGTTPDPIPNSDVKTTSAHDTAPQGAGKSVAARSSEPKPTQTCTHHTTRTPHGSHTTIQPSRQYRGVEQPGSSSGS